MSDIRNFGELRQFLADHPEQCTAVAAILRQSGGTAGATEAFTQEQFVRLIYHLDADMRIPAETLRFVAIAVYPHRGRLPQLAAELGRLADAQAAAEEWEGAEAAQAMPAEVASALEEFSRISGEAAMQETVLTLEVPAQIEMPAEDTGTGDVAEEIDYLEQSWQNIELSQAEQQALSGQVAESREEEIDSEAQLVVVPEQTQPPRTLSEKMRAFLRRRRYFWPELRDTGLWLGRQLWRALRWSGRQLRQGYRWLHVRRFFWPQVWRLICWCALQVAERVRWLRDRQEFYVWLRPYQGNTGYHVLLTRSPVKIRLASSHAKLLARVYEFSHKESLRVIQGVLKSDLSRADREPINQLKDYILIQEKMLTTQECVRDMLNYGIKKMRHTLHKISCVTNLSRLNRHIEGYLLATAEAELLELPKNFRRGLEGCYTFADLRKFMVLYPLYRESVTKQYPPLIVVAQVKHIIADFQRRPNQLTRVLNQHLGTCGEVNLRSQLVKLLHTSQTNEEMWEAVKNERYLDSLLASLRNLEKKKRCKFAARSLRELVTTFLAGSGKFSFADFKASVNFVPEKLQNKVVAMVRHDLHEKLGAEVTALLAQQGKHVQRLDKLRAILADTRYSGSGILLFGYELQAMEQKIAAIEYRDDGMEQALRHVFAGDKVPDQFLQLLAKAKKGEAAAKEKSVANCLRMLEKIAESVARREQVQLFKALSALFQLHGSVNFAAADGDSVSGYQIAEQLAFFYHNPRRTTIELQPGIVAEVRELVKRLVDGEREKQLAKMKK